ncbi:MAG TPA: carboxylating nicotinate-nucleotide diphosphorylase [Chthonomonadaceae bacterium]|nr:carboxylating nicotinate-nucleotide diphosphorylase [Chthonomonadaceae bacterium]
MPTYLPDLADIVRRALAEDVGTGDVTTLFTIPENAEAQATMIAKAPGVVAGLPVVAEVYSQVDPPVAVEFEIEDGAVVQPDSVLCRVRGLARGILTGERVALNFVQRLSGIATLTARFVALVAGTKTRIVDTRKTTPGLRTLEKYAVRLGGGFNHRFGLYDAILIKDNHILAGGGITAAVQNAYAQAPHTMTVTVECDTLDQVREALDAGADIVLLDNMSPDLLAQAVALVNGQVAIEASGGVTEETVAAIAAAGVDIISVGALTHSAPALDISLDLTLW